MATWRRMSEQSWHVARRLEADRNWRGAINRYYYAAFSAVTAELRKIVMDFPCRYEHPPHMQLGRYVKRHLVQFSKTDRDEMRDAIKRLYDARVEADYRHQALITNSEAREARFDAKYVLESLQVI